MPAVNGGRWVKKVNYPHSEKFNPSCLQIVLKSLGTSVQLKKKGEGGWGEEGVGGKVFRGCV